MRRSTLRQSSILTVMVNALRLSAVPIPADGGLNVENHAQIGAFGSRVHRDLVIGDRFHGDPVGEARIRQDKTLQGGPTFGRRAALESGAARYKPLGVK